MTESRRAGRAMGAFAPPSSEEEHCRRVCRFHGLPLLKSPVWRFDVFLYTETTRKSQ
jgi:hypothetical protein